MLPTILYALESWVTCSHNITFLEKFHDHSVRWILEKKWQDKRTTNSVFEEANTTSKEAMIIKHQLRRAGQVLRMDDSRLRKQNIYSVLETGTPTRLPTQSCLLRTSTVPIANQAVLHGLVFTVNSSTASRHHVMVYLRRCTERHWLDGGGQLESLRYFDHHTHFMTCTVIILSCNHVLWLCFSLYVNFM